MRIKVRKVGKRSHQADCLDMPGTPPVGWGRTPSEAIASLFVALLRSDSYQQILINTAKKDHNVSVERVES